MSRRPSPTPCPPPPTRRTLLLGSLALATVGLPACGGGGGGSPAPAPEPPAPAPPAPPAGPTGTLAYRNGSQLELHSFDTDSAIEIDPGTRPGIGNVGVGVSRSGLVTVLQESSASADAWAIVVFDLEGNQVDGFTIDRELAFPNSAAVINADATYIAFSLNEPRSASDDTRVDRTLVAEVASGNVVAQIEDALEPVWIDATGGLLVVEPGAVRLREYSDAWVEVGTIDDLNMEESYGAYDISSDGRYLVYAYAHADEMRVRDLETGDEWVAVTARAGSVLQACFSPDGSHLAVLADSFVFKVPFVLPFELGTTVEVAEDDEYELGAGIVECGGRIGWAE